MRNGPGGEPPGPFHLKIVATYDFHHTSLVTHRAYQLISSNLCNRWRLPFQSDEDVAGQGSEAINIATVEPVPHRHIVNLPRENVQQVTVTFHPISSITKHVSYIVDANIR